jgi:hypothetical protein
LIDWLINKLQSLKFEENNIPEPKMGFNNEDLDDKLDLRNRKIKVKIGDGYGLASSFRRWREWDVEKLSLSDKILIASLIIISGMIVISVVSDNLT